MSLRIIAIGKKHESWVADGIERYQKRLKRPYDVEWLILPHSSLQELQARQEESERILARLSPDDMTILLDERGREVSSLRLAESLREPLDHSRRVTIIIGGAYGVTDDVHHAATWVWSLSPLVFPHQLVRLMLTEQLYRTQEINAGNPYHHT